MTVEMGANLIRVTACVYAVAAVCYVAYLFSKRETVAIVGKAFLWIGLLTHTCSLVVRTISTGQPPFLNMYEYMICMVWSAVVIYLVLEYVTKTRVFGSFIVPLITVASIVAGFVMSSEAHPVPPALKSIWRTPHIASASLAYAAFALAFCLGIMYLIRERSDKNPKSFWASRIPPAANLDRTVYRTIAFGFLMETFLILTGALWAQKSWARYWGWDCKETWSLITWLVYAAYLHTRTIGWKGRKSAILAIIGFIVAMFTLFGVNYLLSGLHSYA